MATATKSVIDWLSYTVAVMATNEDEDPWLNHSPLVADEFEVPSGLRSEQFVLEPLGERHNVADRRAWTSSIEHIQSTPGFEDRDWPRATLTLERNADDLRRHESHFARRVGFTYTVLDPDSNDVIGCVYLYPPRRPVYDADVRSWVCAERAELDKPLYELVRTWLAEAWPFATPEYAAR